MAVAPGAGCRGTPPSWISGAGEGHHLQHISDREMPEGKKAAGALALAGPAPSALRLTSGLGDPRVPLEGRHLGSFLPGVGSLGAGHRGRRLAPAWCPTPYSFPVASGQSLSLFSPEHPILPPFISQPETTPSEAPHHS